MTPHLNGQLNEPPVAWPKVTLGGLSVEVRYDFGINYYLDRAGIDIRKAWSMFDKDHVFTPGDFSLTINLFAAMVASNYPEGSAPSGEYWARQIKSGEQYKAVQRAIAEALVKAMPAVTQTPTQPAQTSPAPSLDLPPQ